MDKCKNCIHYEEGYYKNKGYCHLNDAYVKEDENCEDLEEE